MNPIQINKFYKQKLISPFHLFPSIHVFLHHRCKRHYTDMTQTTVEYMSNKSNIQIISKL